MDAVVGIAANDEVAARRCPVCRGSSTVVMRRLPRYTLERCRTCNHRYAGGMTTDELSDLYQEDSYAGFREDPVFRSNAQRVVEHLLVPRLPSAARVLDVGCGGGDFLRVARECGLVPLGVDVSAAAVRQCAAKGYDAVTGDFLSMRPDHEGGFHLITMWDVVEHLQSPGDFVDQAFRLLAPGGAVLIKTPLVTPAAVDLCTRVPRLARSILQAPHHVQFFEQAALHKLLVDAGLASIEWHWLGALRQSRRTGGPRRRLGRLVLRVLNRVLGNGGLLAIGWKPL